MSDFNIDFIGIGAQRCGSTTLAKVLNQHPKICMSQPKEIRYFNKRNPYIKHSLNKNYFKDLNWYQKHFLHCKRNHLKGEFSVPYLWDTKAPERIHDLFPKTKLIVVLRDPCDRAYSQYLFYKYYFKKETRDFKTAIREEPEYIERGLYYKQLKRYLNYFSKKQIFTLLFDEFINKPALELKRLFAFLNVDESFNSLKALEKSNPARQTRSVLFMKVTESVINNLVRMRLSPIVSFLKGIGVNTLVGKINSKNISYPKLNNEIKDYLRTFFKDDITQLEQLLDLDLSHWK